MPTEEPSEEADALVEECSELHLSKAGEYFVRKIVDITKGSDPRKMALEVDVPYGDRFFEFDRPHDWDSEENDFAYLAENHDYSISNFDELVGDRVLVRYSEERERWVLNPVQPELYHAKINIGKDVSGVQEIPREPQPTRKERFNACKDRLLDGISSRVPSRSSTNISTQSPRSSRSSSSSGGGLSFVGVVLMVAVTTVLAAVMGSLVMGAAVNLEQASELEDAEASIEVAESGDGEVVATVTAVQTIGIQEMEVASDARVGYPDGSQLTEPGESIQVTGLKSGDTIEVVASKQESSAVVKRYTVP